MINAIKSFFNPSQKYQRIPDLEMNESHLSPNFNKSNLGTDPSPLLEWQKLYSLDICKDEGEMKIRECSQRILKSLRTEGILTLENADMIACHLWSLAKVSSKKSKTDDMLEYFSNYLDRDLGPANKKIAARIQAAMFSSNRRSKYFEEHFIDNF